MTQTQTAPKTVKTTVVARRIARLDPQTEVQQDFLTQVRQIHAEMCASQVTDPGTFAEKMKARAPITGVYGRAFGLAMRSSTLTLAEEQLEDIVKLLRALTDARLVLVGNPNPRRDAAKIRLQLLALLTRVDAYSQEGLRNQLHDIIMDGGKLVRTHIDAHAKRSSKKVSAKSAKKAASVEQAIRDENPDATWAFASENELNGVMAADEH